MANRALKELSADFSKMYAAIGRPSIPPEKLIRALSLQVLYSIRSERLLMEELNYNLLFRWFVGLSMEDSECECCRRLACLLSRVSHLRSAYAAFAFFGCSSHLPSGDSSDVRRVGEPYPEQLPVRLLKSNPPVYLLRRGVFTVNFY